MVTHDVGDFEVVVALYDRELDKLVETKLTRRFNVKKFEKYYRMKFFDDYLISFRRKEKEIEKELDYCGYFVLVSSEKTTAEEALTKYRHRDASEKQFLIEKSFLGETVLFVFGKDINRKLVYMHEEKAYQETNPGEIIPFSMAKEIRAF